MRQVKKGCGHVSIPTQLLIFYHFFTTFFVIRFLLGDRRDNAEVDQV